MARFLRWTLWAAGVLCLLTVVAVGALFVRSEQIIRERHTIDAPEFTTPLPTDSASIAEGRRIAFTRGCPGCHGEALEGQVFFEEPWIARLVAPNLTKLVREHTDAELERSIRHGIEEDGTSLFGMPAEMYRSLSGDDLARLLAWIRSLPEVEGDSRERSIGPLGRLGIALGEFRTSRYYIETEAVLPVPSDPALVLGHYVATTSCTECHGNTMLGDGFGSPPLPPLAVVYSADEFAAFFRSGVTRSGLELPMMSGVARGRLSHLTADEVTSLHAYLRSLHQAGAS